MSYQGPAWRPTQRLPVARVPAAPPPASRRPPLRRPAPRRRPGRIVAAILGVLALVVIGFAGYVDRAMQRTDALADYPGRIADSLRILGPRFEVLRDTAPDLHEYLDAFP